MALIHQAAAFNQLDLVQKCIDGGANVNGVDPEHGRTPLHFAAEKGHVTLVRLLMAFGARSGIIDYYGLTPYELAEENNHVEVMRILKPGEASPDGAGRGGGESVVPMDCPHCLRALRIPARFAGQTGRCTHCGGRITVPRLEADLPRFDGQTTGSFEDAVRIIFQQALPATRIEAEQRILEDYTRIARVWQSRELVEASTEGLRNIVAKNLKAMAFGAGCAEFQIVVDDEGTWAAQVMGHNPEAIRLLAIRIWRGSDRLYACGGSDFIAHA